MGWKSVSLTLALLQSGVALAEDWSGVLPPHRTYVERLIQIAEQKKLASHPMWHRLLHYRTSTFGGVESEADGMLFFTSSVGKTNPDAELRSTLASFFSPVVRRENVQHAACRFPARLAWLSSELNIDLARLPIQDCPRFAKFFSDLSAQSVSLIFSSYYLNNPASAFGHTFLKFNKDRSIFTGVREELLDQGVDFSADVDSDNAILYAFKGLTGMFPGTFKQQPFYYKVREYNDHESRDLWEYELNFSKPQLAMLIAHIWELGSTYFDYYYITENCSYHVLGVLEVADLRLKLIKNTATPAIPADTVRTVLSHHNILKEVRYRPSLRKRFAVRREGLSDGEAHLLPELLDHPMDPALNSLPRLRQAYVLDAALDLADIQYGAQVYKKNTPAAKKKQSLLERRAALSVITQDPRIPVPYDKNPARGHPGRRFGIGAGAGHWSSQGLAPSVGIDFRLALHDLADPPAGYPDLSAIEFTAGRVELVKRNDAYRVRLDDIAFVRITSLTSMSRFEPKISWKTNLGVTTTDDLSCEFCIAVKGGVGGGFAKSWAKDAFTIFLLIDNQLWLSPSFTSWGGLHLGVGPYAGIRWRLSSSLIYLTQLQAYWLPFQDPGYALQNHHIMRWAFADRWAVSFEGRVNRHGYWETWVYPLHYF